MGFGGPSLPPTPPPPPPVPDAADEAIRQIQKAKRTRDLAATGLKSTFLTGPQGLVAPPPVAPKSLLGQ
jgi:hypothetical protein